MYHHAQGVTEGLKTFADELRAAGHTVHVPDLFEGRTFGSIDEGMAYVNEVGFDEVVERGMRAANGLPHEMVCAGFSLGVVVAQKLAQTRQGVRGALFFYSCVPPAMFGTPFPENLPVQIHGMDADPYFVEEGDLEAARAIVAVSNTAELFLYPGNQHYFADSSLPSYDEVAAALLLQRVLAYLRKLDK